MSGISIKFGPFRFDVDRGLLYKNGRLTALGGKCAILLRLLLEARGDVVAKSDLMDAAWPSLRAEESNLTVQISALRRCLGDDRRSPTWIETIHTTGYRFSGDFAIERGRSMISRASNSTLQDRPVVALRPFEPLGRASPHAHILEGFHDSLVFELSRLPVLLIATGRSAEFEEQPLDFGAADFCISGRVGVRQSSLSVEATIGDCRARKAPGRVCVFDGDLSELFTIQAEVAHRIASLLRAAIPVRTSRGDYCLNDVAQWHYHRGYELLVRSHSGNQAARRHLSKAVELDAGFAKAHAFLGIGHYTAAIHYGEDVIANRALALAYVRKAVSLAPEESTTHGALGFVQLYEGRHAEAEDRLLAARHYDPSDAYVLMNTTELRVFQGRHDEAIAHAEDAIRQSASPPSWYYWVLAFGCYAAGMYAEAIDALKRPEIEMFPGKRLLAASLARLGNLKEAKLEAEKFLAVHPGFRVSGWSETQPFMSSSDRRHFIDGFTRAGFPR